MPRPADAPRCGLLCSQLSRGGRSTKRACRNWVRTGEPRCWKHLDLFAWAAAERKVRARLGEEQRQRIMEAAFTWTDQVEDVLADVRRWRAEHAESDAVLG